jgi:hypothetical protein
MFIWCKATILKHVVPTGGVMLDLEKYSTTHDSCMLSDMLEELDAS